MGLSKKLRFTINTVILSISIIMWILLLINPGHIMTIEHCHVSASGPSAKSLKMLLDMNPFFSQLLGWGLMVIAMMLPKLIMPVQFIYIRSLKKYRFLFSILFITGYISTWIIAGIFLVWMIIGFNLWMPMSFLPAIIVGLIALIWQLSPIKQYFLNRGHDHWNLPAFGWPAIRSVFQFGIMHGIWCIGAGWAIMLFPMLLPKGHNVAMIAVTFIMISEHLEHPVFPKWGFHFRLKLFKIIIGQIRLKFVVQEKINF